jgi:hypothetical protein
LGHLFSRFRHEPEALSANLLNQEIYGDQRTAFNPGLEVLISAELLMHGSEDGASPGLI